MTVSATVSRWTYVGNGVTTVFSYGNRIFAASDLNVYVDGELEALGLDYTVSGVGAGGGGSVTFASAPANGAAVAIVRAVPATQAIDFVANESLRADTLELGLDKATVLAQQILAKLGRALVLAEGDPAPAVAALPLKSELASKVLGFDAAGEPIAVAGASSLGPVSAYAATLLDDADAAAARATLGISSYWRTRLTSDTAADLQGLLGASSDAAVADLLVGVRDWRGRNRTINGNFELWQRGTSLGSGSGARWLADRWRNDSTGSTYTASQQAFTLGQTAVPNEPTYFHRTVVASVANAANYCVVGQRVEGVRTLAGKTVTLSFSAKANASKPMAVELVQSFGTGGSPSSDVTAIGATKISLTSSWQKFTVGAAVPSISGKTLGSNGDNYLALIFWFDAGSNYNSRTGTLGQQSGTFDIARVQLEEGSVATPFELRPIAVEVDLCQRYFRKSYDLDVDPGTATLVGQLAIICYAAGSGIRISPHFSPPMRAAPTVTTYSGNSGTAGKYLTGASTDKNSQVTDIGVSGFTIAEASGQGPGSITSATAQFTADAEL